jgi:hypothetical protein
MLQHAVTKLLAAVKRRENKLSEKEVQVGVKIGGEGEEMQVCTWHFKRSSSHRTPPLDVTDTPGQGKEGVRKR